MSTARDELKFEPIPGHKGGYAALTIYKPGTFFGRDGQHAVFVGGCGWGRRKTLKDAKVFLLECAKEYCQRQIDEAEAQRAHYTAQLAKLEARGLVKSATGEPR